MLALIARGLSNAEIMRELHLSVGSVKTHIGRLLGKLQARDRAQLVIIAYESGLVQWGDLPAPLEQVGALVQRQTSRQVAEQALFGGFVP